jgi:hypothetical protein
VAGLKCDIKYQEINSISKLFQVVKLKLEIRMDQTILIKVLQDGLIKKTLKDIILVVIQEAEIILVD